jgi:hypothetical protein
VGGDVKEVKRHNKLFFVCLLTMVLNACANTSSSFPKDSYTRPHSQPQAELKPGPIHKACLGTFCFEMRSMGDKQVVRYLKKNQILSRYQFINSLADENEPDIRLIFNQSIAKLPDASAYMVWAPVINKTTKDMPFYLVAMSKPAFKETAAANFAPQFKHCDPHPKADEQQYLDRFLKMYALENGHFLERLSNDTGPDLKNGAVIFKGGVLHGPNASEIMVSPCPIDRNLSSNLNAPLINIYSFAKLEGQLARLHSFWLAVGKTALMMFDGDKVKDLAGNEKKELLLNTHGIAINYLHFRIETESADYNHYKEHAGEDGVSLRDEKKSHEYYTKVFDGFNQ